MTVDILYKMSKGEMSVDQMPVDDLSAKEMSPCHCRSFRLTLALHLQLACTSVKLGARLGNSK